MDNGAKAKLCIFNEENFEEDIVNFCKEHNLDDNKRKKLQKLVKTQLIEMFEEGELGQQQDENQDDSDKDQNAFGEIFDEKNRLLIDEINFDIERANNQ